MTDKLKYREFEKVVDEILWKEWDPIGVNDCLGAEGEYSSYARTLCDKLYNGEDRQAILDYLFWAESKNMGFGGDRKNYDKKNTVIIDKIMNLFRSCN